ncbi:Spy/CpxP family protein refolding chaperone [Microbaculum marinisediminis]|uniref:Spy/CpxP family protein refolding chaperone n=1 Tax=Microbaculum marinisediminis TaxID=2931392 RepID=A0AAW5R413_9HYPH|nr:Spy/CpxP family protein refolding chaperone [Microbaculum sp. A6E488]MCT8974673.1 Spy/CpxP family protein refolding chaperone [Microbaculum sp. A6E488]
MPNFKWMPAVAAGMLALAIASPTSLAAGESSWWDRMGRMMGGGPPIGEWAEGPMMGRHGTVGMSGPMMGLGVDMMLERVDGRLAYLKTELKITDDQESAWDEFSATIRSTAERHNDTMRSMMEEYSSGEFLRESLPDRLALQETHLEARLEQVRAVHSSADKLFAVLTDEQKEIADEIVLPTIGMGVGRPRGFGQQDN